MQLDKETRLGEPPAPDPFLDRTFDGYRVEALVGRGGMGAVYKATQLSLNRPVAIKVLPSDVADHPQFLERFHREVDILSKLAHPNIVTVFERGEVDGRQYLVMEFVRGTSLREVIKKGPLPRAEALTIVRSVLAALEHAHDKGVVHRDIKPENVLVAPGGIVKVADFGLSRLLGPANVTRLTHTHLLLGTFEYMAPEQREKAKEADERSDLYATGVVLYEMLTGELPIGHFELPSAKRPKECDGRIDEVVKRSLEKDPAKRWQRASEMGGEVSRLLSAAALPEEKGEGAPGEGGVHPLQRMLLRHAGRKHRRHGPMSEHDIAESIRAAMNPWAVAGYIVGVWWLLVLAFFGANHQDERFWLFTSGISTALYFTAVPLLHKKRYLTLGLVGAVLTGIAYPGLDAVKGASRFRGWSFDAVEYTGPLQAYQVESLAESVLRDADVQLWIKRNITLAPDTYPRGVEVYTSYWNGSGCLVGVRVPRSMTAFESTAQDLAAAMAIALEARIEGARRILTGSASTEASLRGAGVPAETKGGG